MRSPFVMLLTPAVLFAAPVPKDKPKVKDDEAIVGSWQIESFDNGGGPGGPSAAEIATMRFVFAEKGVVKLAGGPNGEQMEGAYKLDPEAKLKTIDMTLQTQSVKGVYALDGDTLTLCIPDGANKERPTEIKADNTARIAVVTFKRVKVDEKKDK